jgi:hypothetical protein
MPVNEIALRRLRGMMLASAHERLHGEPRKRRFAWLAVAAPIVVLTTALLLGWYLRKPSAEDFVQLEASTGAVWTRTAVSGIEYLDLADGLLNISVGRRPLDPRLIVRVPDGEVEDTGTRFRVWVSGGRTREIAVETGSVVYRRADGSSIALRSGAVWRLDQMPAGPATGAPAPATPVAVPSNEQPARTPSSSPAPAVAMPTTQARRGSPAARIKKLPLNDTSNTVGGATDEDLAYLHIVALLHEARDEEARLAARDYLRRYPEGFRRVEVSELLESPPPKP